MKSPNNYDKIVELYKLMGEDKELLKVFYANDYPVPYKSLLLYPVQMDLYLYFHILVECLVLPHKTSGDINAISMSYFDYLFYLTENGKPQYLFQLIELLAIVLKKDKKYIDKDGKENDYVYISRDVKNKHAQLIIGGEVYDTKDFDLLREIICIQNAIELPDETTNPDIVLAYKEMEEYRRKQSKIKMCTWEDQINIVVAKSSYKRDDVLQMTIRSFSRLLARVDKIMHYEIMMMLSPNMEKKDRQTIEHYMSSLEKDNKYSDMFIDLEKFKEEKGLA